MMRFLWPLLWGLVLLVVGYVGVVSVKLSSERTERLESKIDVLNTSMSHYNKTLASINSIDKKNRESRDISNKQLNEIYREMVNENNKCLMLDARLIRMLNSSERP